MNLPGWIAVIIHELSRRKKAGRPPVLSRPYKPGEPIGGVITGPKREVPRRFIPPSPGERAPTRREDLKKRIRI